MAGDDRLLLKAFIDASSIDRQLKSIQQKAKKLKFTVGVSGGIDKTNKSLSQMLKHITNIPIKMAAWQLAGQFVSSLFQSIRSGVATVFALDMAMTNINMTMELTNEQQKDLTENAFETANAYNTTAESVLRVTQIFSNLSETIETLNDKVETTIALANVTGTSATSMSDAIQGMGFQFDIASESVSHISDVMVAIARTTGVDLSKSIQSVSQAVRTAGSVAADSGFSLEAFAATIQTVQEQSRLAGSTIASGLVTVLSRMSRVTREGEESVSKLDELLQRQGINLRDSNLEFRNRFEVLQEVAAAQDSWNSTTQEAIKFELAGWEFSTAPYRRSMVYPILNTEYAGKTC